MATVTDVFPEAARRLRKIAADATPGPWRKSAVPGVLRCGDAPDGSEAHLCYGIARKEDLRLMVAADPETIGLLAEVVATAAPGDSALPAMINLVNHLNAKITLRLDAVEQVRAGEPTDFDDSIESFR